MKIITIVRKPLDPAAPTVAANALKWGTVAHELDHAPGIGRELGQRRPRGQVLQDRRR